MMRDEEKGVMPAKPGRLRKVVGIGLGLALGALAGIVLGLVAGVGIATILGVL
jgi:hypothetical protein